MAEEKRKNVLDSLNDSFLEFSESIFGADGRQFIEKTQTQVKEFNVQMIRSFVDFGDMVVDSLNLNENEVVKKSSDSVKDLLRQMDILEEESEEDF